MEQINKMKYKFNRDGEWIDAGEKETWCWEAVYDDGTELKQFGDDGIFHQFKEIDQSKLHYFKMVHEEKPCYTLLFNPQKYKLIHFYKRTRLNMGTNNEIFFTVYCFGYEVKIHGRTSKTNLMILPSGETVMTEDTNLINFQ